MKCKHEWQGDCTGVKCLICGERLSRDEFQKLCKKKGKEKEIEEEKDEQLSEDDSVSENSL